MTKDESLRMLTALHIALSGASGLPTRRSRVDYEIAWEQSSEGFSGNPAPSLRDRWQIIAIMGILCDLFGKHFIAKAATGFSCK